VRDGHQVEHAWVSAGSGDRPTLNDLLRRLLACLDSSTTGGTR
jgi:hypothetical protein